MEKKEKKENGVATLFAKVKNVKFKAKEQEHSEKAPKK